MRRSTSPDRARSRLPDVARRYIAVMVTVFAVPGVIGMFGEAGPAPGWPRTVAIAIILSTVPVAAVVANARSFFTWGRRDRGQRTGALAFTLYADLGTGFVLVLFQEKAIAGAALFAVISSFVAFFGGRESILAHLVLTTVFIVIVTMNTLERNSDDLAGVVSASICVWLAVNGTLSLVNASSRSLQRNVERQVQRAQTDPLTGLLNLRGLESVARRDNEARRLAFVLVDVDHFKAVNDRHGHLAGDSVLVLLADRLRTFIGEDGAVARRGGEEFLLLLDAAGANLPIVAESVRLAVSVDTDEIPVSVSIGVAVVDSVRFDDGDVTALLSAGMHLADIAMYRAKAAGRNTVMHYDG